MKFIRVGRERYALVDDKDFELVSKLKWSINSFGYAKNVYYCSGKRKCRSLHRFIMGNPSDLAIDHINGIRLDCRRENLRLCTPAENLRNRGAQSNNTSGYKGVCPNDGGWIASISIDKTLVYLGWHKDKEEAAYIYDQAAIQLHGEFARTNILY